MYFTPGWGVVATTTVGLVGVLGTLAGTALALRQGRWLHRQELSEARRVEQRESILELLEVAARLRPVNLAFARTVEDADLTSDAGLAEVDAAHLAAVEQGNLVLLCYRRSSLVVSDPAIIAALDEFLKQFDIVKQSRNLLNYAAKNGKPVSGRPLRTNQAIFDDVSQALLRTTRDSLQKIDPHDSPRPPTQTTQGDSG